jgi:hypothetical protein
MSAVSSATARHAHAARTALRNASAVLLAAPPRGPVRRPFPDGFKTGSRATEPNGLRVAALSVPRTPLLESTDLVAELPPAY